MESSIILFILGRMFYQCCNNNTPSQWGRHPLPLQPYLGSAWTSPLLNAWWECQWFDHFEECTKAWLHVSTPYLGCTGTWSPHVLTCHGILDSLKYSHSFHYHNELWSFLASDQTILQGDFDASILQATTLTTIYLAYLVLSSYRFFLSISRRATLIVSRRMSTYA